MGSLAEPVMPDYGGPNVSGIVPALLGRRRVDWLPEAVEGARATVLLVLDGLGWEALVTHPDEVPELHACGGGPVTTVVPSTTPAALTSITTGLAPARHGVTGFRVRHERSVLNVIRWQQADGTRPPDPTLFQRHETFAGRPVPVVTKTAFRSSGFTGVHLRDGEFHGWQTTAVLVEHVRTLVGAGAPFVYAYYPGVDEVAHAYGLASSYYPAELRAADELVGGLLDVLPGDVALVVTADHGQVQVGPEGWVELDPLDPLVAMYAGDGRFRYLHARAGAAAELLAGARELAGDRAWVFTRDELLEGGWLGADPLPAARRRVGDVVLAARAPVGFVDPDLLTEAQLVAAHGSITATEMLVPLVAARGRA